MISSEYYEHEQTSLLELVTKNGHAALEIGCAAGSILLALNKRNFSRITGVEYVPHIADAARHKVPNANILSGSVDDISDFDLGDNYDLLVASHVLEHLTDPWRTLGRLASKLKHGGQFVGALPNVRHWSVTFPLIFNGNFTYRDQGILDRTHYRFFTRSTVIQLLESQGFGDIKIKPVVAGRKSIIANKLTFGLTIDLFCFAFQFSATKLGE
jgi:2-polyprenyl-3-methyl-5-hydroxy-6-metoxy-1,4-benzoquinol methylase